MKFRRPEVALQATSGSKLSVSQKDLVFPAFVCIALFLGLCGDLPAQTPAQTPAPQSNLPAVSGTPQDDAPNSNIPRTDAPNEDAAKNDAAKKAADDQQTIEIPQGWKRLGKREIWIDFKKKQIIVGGSICLNEGALEMFVCPTNTKEHESVIAANALASEVHAALIALNVAPGKPCQWDPEYKPAFGPVIDIDILWMDEAKKQIVKRPAESFIRDSETKKAMTHQWVFGGSEIYEEPDTGEKFYYGDSGEMICLSNFSTATMDLTVESSQSNDGLLFEAFTENIPPVGTKVYVVLTPGQRIGIDGKPEPEKKAVEKADDKLP
jgi:hypothetical protein